MMRGVWLCLEEKLVHVAKHFIFLFEILVRVFEGKYGSVLVALGAQALKAMAPGE